jgi:hypothetical protein
MRQRDVFAPQVAHDADGEHPSHALPPLVTTPSLPMAEKSETARCVSSLPQFGHVIGASASDISRRASNIVSQSEHLYS